MYKITLCYKYSTGLKANKNFYQNCCSFKYMYVYYVIILHDIKFLYNK